MDVKLLKKLIILMGDIFIIFGVASASYLINEYFDTGREFIAFICVMVILYLRIYFKYGELEKKRVSQNRGLKK